MIEAMAPNLSYCTKALPTVLNQDTVLRVVESYLPSPAE